MLSAVKGVYPPSILFLSESLVGEANIELPPQARGASAKLRATPTIRGNLSPREVVGSSGAERAWAITLVARAWGVSFALSHSLSLDDARIAVRIEGSSRRRILRKVRCYGYLCRSAAPKGLK